MRFGRNDRTVERVQKKLKKTGVKETVAMPESEDEEDQRDIAGLRCMGVLWRSLCPCILAQNAHPKTPKMCKKRPKLPIRCVNDKLGI
jgi:hypothetical protein